MEMRTEEAGSVRVPYRPRSGSAAVRRRRGSFRRTLGLLLLVILGAAVVGAVLLWGRVAAFNDRVSTAPAASSALFFPLNGSDRVNVLLVGYAGETATEHAGVLLADSIQVLSIDPATDMTTVIPIPRDLWIEGQPQLPLNGKANEVFAAAFEEGGVGAAGQATAEVISEVTGLRIDHWMTIDFEGFREMVDAVGGVAIENPVAFEYTWDENFYNQGVWDAGSFAAGTLHLDGEQALSYARTRYTSEPSESSDFARSARQQRIMSALRAKLGEGGISSVGPGLQLMGALEDRLVTSLSAVDLFFLSGHLGADRRIELAEGVILEAAFNDIGQYVLVVIGRQTPSDYEPLHAFLAEELARPIEPAASASPTP
jgi:LCP family protein required for cell wall assembly